MRSRLDPGHTSNALRHVNYCGDEDEALGAAQRSGLDLNELAVRRAARRMLVLLTPHASPAVLTRMPHSHRERQRSTPVAIPIVSFPRSSELGFASTAASAPTLARPCKHSVRVDCCERSGRAAALP
jgi:hypothetical protein